MAFVWVKVKSKKQDLTPSESIGIFTLKIENIATLYEYYARNDIVKIYIAFILDA